MRIWISGAVLALSLLAVGAPLAHAGDEYSGLVLNGTVVKPLGERGTVSNSAGAGGEIHLAPDDNILVSIGGFAALGRPQGDKTERDIYDVHFGVGLSAGDEGLQPFLGLGLDVLAMTTRTGERTFRGTTLGMSAQAGVAGRFADRWMYRAGASFLGAVVPGTGDDLGGLVLQLGLGRTFDM